MRRSNHTATKRQKIDTLSAETKSQTQQRAEWKTFLESQFFLNASDELLDLFEMALKVQPESPCDAFVDTLGIRLTGPLTLLAVAYQKEFIADKPLYIHGRFFFDPPEVTTVMVDSDSDKGRHWGYFRDAPDEIPEYVVCAESSLICKFNIVGSSIVQVLQNRLKERQLSLQSKVRYHIETYVNERSKRQSTSVLRAKRSNQCVASSLHQLGIVVPIDTKTNTGYRELPISGTDLSNLLQQLKEESTLESPARKKLSELITRAAIATDECDFGTGLLLGLDLFTAGLYLEKEALQLLRVAYMLLHRANFYKIASGHCKYRHEENLLAPINFFRANQ